VIKSKTLSPLHC